MNDAIKDRVKQVVAKHLKVNEAEITENTSFVDDLNADSLDTVELMMAFEEEFQMELNDEDAEKIKTVKDAVAFIENHQSDAA